MNEKPIPNQEIPLFPLQTVLFPDGVLGLQIFEVRYLKMIRECMDTASPFGVVTLQAGGEVQRPNEELALANIGTLATITHFVEESPTLFRLLARGGRRFHLHEAHQASNGLWMGLVTVFDEEPQVSIPTELAHTSVLLHEVIQSLESQQDEHLAMPIAKPYKLHDCAWVANRWCDLLQLNKLTKLQLLALDNPLIRLELINDELDRQSEQE